MDIFTDYGHLFTGHRIWFWHLNVFIIGCCIGSFLQACAWRIPNKVSVIFPKSRCPQCRTVIKSYHNLPVIGWLVLGGKCFHCKSKIPARYIIVEITAGLLFELSWLIIYVQRINILFLPVSFIIISALILTILLIPGTVKK